MDTAVEQLYHDENIEDISIATGLHKTQIRMILSKFGRTIRNPDIIDNDDVLIKAYMRKYREASNAYDDSIAMLAARTEVNRLISLGEEIRKLREIALQNNQLSFNNNEFRDWASWAEERLLFQ